MADTVKIGKSTVTTTKLGLGTNKVGGHNLFADLNDQDGVDVITTALENNITLLDTAFMYGKGRSEEIIGDVLQGLDRSKVVIATKAAQDPDNDLELNNTPAFLKQAVDEALTRLKTDYIDIFYIHFPDEATPKNEALAALNELKQAGKIKAIGVSNFSFDQLKEANQDDLVDIVEDNYSLVHRDAEKELFPYLKEHQISFVPYFPLASGLLTGKYTEADAGKFTGRFSEAQFKQIIAAVDGVRAIATAHDATVAQTIIAWYLANPNISVVIPGARKPEQVESNAKALDVTLTADEYDRIDELFSAFK
ncbi:aldo/keto reductase [Furfurilactobacillus siliginis]|uniref:Dehydrogenase n=1 Tax=Furfurilactobacillus siliginis TaxID=348151 RepID=A0A0R2L610_9LACO|nr:aldo/keto reductase [Furfurilactobacillus siliginis]KRN97240.1 dehydrogenase [Furfurilactobacillus siliginis]GEK29613.1 oxidoreductase ion channel protein IolS [Furfurilactobacillus siliginis]